MAKITFINGDSETAADFAFSLGRFEFMLTDPPFDLCAEKLAKIVDAYRVKHLVLLTTLNQLIEFLKVSDWQLKFDFVFNSVQPKKSKNFRQPNYTHVTGVYLTRPGVASVFTRKLRQRSDTFVFNGYWPTIFNAPRNHSQKHGQSKNIDAITDLLGSFEIESVVDIFAGLGTTGIAANLLDLNCLMFEKNQKVYNGALALLKFFSVRLS